MKPSNLTHFEQITPLKPSQDVLRKYRGRRGFFYRSTESVSYRSRTLTALTARLRPGGHPQEGFALRRPLSAPHCPPRTELRPPLRLPRRHKTSRRHRDAGTLFSRLQSCHHSATATSHKHSTAQAVTQQVRHSVSQSEWCSGRSRDIAPYQRALQRPAVQHLITQQLIARCA